MIRRLRNWLGDKSNARHIVLLVAILYAVLAITLYMATA